jgi:hypothetical protein
LDFARRAWVFLFAGSRPLFMKSDRLSRFGGASQRQIKSKYSLRPLRLGGVQKIA